MLDDLRQRLRALFKRETVEREIDDELRFHFDRQVEKYTQAGHERAEAVRRARLEFGGLDQIKEEYRDSLGVRVITEVRRDVVLAVRTLKRQPGFTATAALTLALGIGATTAIFSVVYGVLLKPLPFYEPDRLVALNLVTPASRTDILPASAYFTYRENGRVFEEIGLWQTGNVFVTRNGAPEQVSVARITDGTLPLLGIRPELGRLIGKEDDAPGAPPRVVLTHAYWQQAFGKSKDVIGTPLIVDAQSYEIIGVLPASFKLLNTDPQLLLPLRLNRANVRIGAFIYNGIARLRPAVTIDQANADVARMLPLIAKQFPFDAGITQEMWDSVGLAPNVRPLSEAVIGDMARPLWILLGTVVFVLLLAWMNVANLLLVRAETRQREFAVRGALGAGRGRIAVELLSESVALGLAGAALGLLFAKAGIGLLRRIAPVALPRVEDISINGVVLLFTFVLSILTAVLFGLMPVWRLGRPNFVALKEAGRSVSDAPGRHRARNALVVAQVALALVLLIVSGLMARTFIALGQVQPGFARPTEVQMFDLSLPASLIRDRQQVVHTYEQIAERLKQVPGVNAVGVGTIRLDGGAAKAPIYVQGRPVSGLPPVGSIWPIGAGYFQTLGGPIVSGRAIAWADLQFKPVVVISENLAREYWARPSDALGKRIGFFPEGPWLEVVGVVGNVRADGLNQPAPRLVYQPLANAEYVNRNMTYLVRSSRAGRPDFVRELQQAVGSINPHVPLIKVRTLADLESDSMAQTSFAMVMLAIAAPVALLLALVGIYGVVSYIAAERTYEIGIRMAVGAQAGDVRALFLRHGLALTVVGIALGIGAAMLLTPIMSSLLYGVRAIDPLTYAAVAIALSAVTLLATYVPARRASRIEPIVALRSGL